MILPLHLILRALLLEFLDSPTICREGCLVELPLGRQLLLQGSNLDLKLLVELLEHSLFRACVAATGQGFYRILQLGNSPLQVTVVLLQSLNGLPVLSLFVLR